MSIKSEPAVNGIAAAAILASGIGCFAIGLISCIADHSKALSQALDFYNPTGPLSGVTTCALLVWIFSWSALHLRWRARSLELGRINAITFALLLVGVLLTFPPIVDLI